MPSSLGHSNYVKLPVGSNYSHIFYTDKPKTRIPKKGYVTSPIWYDEDGNGNNHIKDYCT